MIEGHLRRLSVLPVAFWVGERERLDIRLEVGLGYVPLKLVFMIVVRSIPGEMRFVFLLSPFFHFISVLSLLTSFFQALYKALQISLPRYKSLRSLRLFVSHEPFVHDRDHLEHYRNGLATNNIDSVNYYENGQDSDDVIPSAVEQILIDSWLKLCPSLEVVTLFSGSQWRKELDDRQEELWSAI